MSLLVGFAPSITARRGVQGRKVVAEAFEDYFTHEGHKEASVLVQKRYETSARNGVSVPDISRYEVGAAIAMLANTAPAVFWIILLVYSNPDLLSDIRTEIEAATVRKTDAGRAGSSNSLDITILKKTCPLLASTFQEVLRYRSIGTSVRQVMEDTVLAEQYLLRKGSMIQMPSRVIHSDPSIWGSDVDEFKPRRFMREAKEKTSTSSKAASAAAFRAFGGGMTLCPGRHFATNEILAVFAMFIMQYDMAPVDGGEFTLPTTSRTNVTTVIMEPDVDIEVEVSKRKGYEHESWSFSLESSGDIFAVVVEDRSDNDS